MSALRNTLVAFSSVVVLSIGSLAGCSSAEETPEYESSSEEIRSTSELIGTFDRVENRGRFLSIEFQAGLRYSADTGIRCITTPCPSGEAGTYMAYQAWTGRQYLRLNPTGRSASTWYEIITPNGGAIELRGITDGNAKLVKRVQAACRPTGCSGEMCSDRDVMGICIFQPEYACYSRIGICERGSDGNCGWRQTPELQACIDDAQPFCPRALCPVNTTCDETARACVPTQSFCSRVRCASGTVCDEAARACVPTTNFVCPAPGTTINCMPGPQTPKPQCGSAYRTWIIGHCPDVQFAF